MNWKLLLPAALAVCTVRAETPPDILFLLADDQSFETLGLVGGEVQTPNLDRLAQRGTLFTRAYNMGAWGGSVCVASRAMLLTGRSVWNARAALPESNTSPRKTWPQHLAAAGYETYMTGKWHVDAPAEQLFDRVVHLRPGSPKQVPEGYFRPAPGNAWTPWNTRLGGHWEGGRHWSEVLGDDAIEFINHAKDREKPFFLYLAFSAPHDPRQSPRKFVEMYPRDQIRVPDNFLPEYPYKQEIGCYRSGNKNKAGYLRDEKLAPWPRTPEAVRLHRQEYYAIISHLDEQAGRILDALEASGRAERTVVIFSSDHGLACGHHGLMGKQNLYEESLRVPLILAGPGIPAGLKIDVPVYYQDVVPTTLELAGQPVPADFEFKSLLPLLRGERTNQYDALYACMWPDRQRAAVQDGWKLIHYPKAGVHRLYHLDSDPAERRDLAADPAAAGRLAQLKQTLARLQEQMNDPLLRRGGRPEQAEEPEDTDTVEHNERIP